MTADEAPTSAVLPSGHSRPVLDLRGESTRWSVLLVGLFRARGLLLTLARHDFQARYRSASFGLAWSVVLPLVQGAVLATVFTKVVRVGSGSGYVVDVLIGQQVWSYFSQTVTIGATSIVDGGEIAGKIYFPRLLLPATPALANAVGFVMSLLIAFAVSLIMGQGVHAGLLVLPAAVLLAVATAVAFAAPLALLHVYSRDVRYIVTAMLLVAFYATPVIYPLSRVHGLRSVIEANPMTGIVQLAQWSVLGHADALAVPLLATAGWLLGLAVVTVAAYARYERVACDRL